MKFNLDKICQIIFNQEANRLDVDIDFKKGLNSVIQTAKRTARGDGLRHFHTMTFLHTGQLNLSRVNPLLPIRFG